MARTRAEREADFRAEHGVSSGTYYTMRRDAAASGISGKTFDKVAQAGGYGAAKGVAQTARTDLEGAREQALRTAAAAYAPSGFAWSDFDSSMDYDWIPDDFDWFYH